ncbi:hypothetical protein PHYSODRAFT_335393 [Phytophthora sojae]|uniref:Uncharacterized protein n=1 Tax=Phytophthora sojae (strain P6497) TaxID=1094619 RepID=G4ZV21_PHYSP|nr:hypothetical protein PHYSODRAFT_335393 [Phytophthora sojae]EGZ13645.1 hypothetical protein PHYSODRAFT_335393 [Phytophthora sojae]|eukprot:XP_009531074.1 hypothetical protein PHYSODRAFT_335393 [Phytophthora sojae]
MKMDSQSVVYPPDDHVPHNRRNSAFVVDNASPTLLTALPPGVAVNHVQLRDAKIPLQDPEMEHLQVDGVLPPYFRFQRSSSTDNRAVRVPSGVKMEPEVAMTTTSQAPNLPSDRDTQTALALGSSVSTMGVTTVAVYRSSDRRYGGLHGST